MIKRMWKVLLPMAGVIIGCAILHPQSPKPTVLVIPGLTYSPPPIYGLWFREAHICALSLQRVRGVAAEFSVDTIAADLNAITWIAVPTERADWSFAGMLNRNGDTIFVWGMTSAGNDTIWLPAPALQSKGLLKHEAMHIFVASPGENNIGAHGLPWGFCEFV